MNTALVHILTDELCYMREQARYSKQWKLSDEIRDELETRSVFINDTNDGQEVTHTPGWTKEQWLARIANDRRYNAAFDAWLFTMESKVSA